MANVAFNPAFVLHQRPYRETSLLLDVLTQDHGRINLIAKGVKQKKRSQAGLIQQYQPLLLSWTQGTSSLYTMTAVEAGGPPYKLMGESSLCGLYINELMVKLLPIAEADKAIYQAYVQAIEGLQQAAVNEITLRVFEKQLLAHLGYGLALSHEVESGEAIQADRDYYYRAESGLFYWQPGSKYHRISGRSLQHLNNERGFDETSLLEIKQLMRGVIQFYLAGRPLQSRELFKTVHRMNKEES